MTPGPPRGPGRIIQRLVRAGRPTWVVRDGPRVLIRAIAAAGAPFVPAIPGRVFRPCLLSRFACLRRDGTLWRLESPLSVVRFEFRDQRVTRLIGALASPVRLAPFCASVGLSREQGLAVVGLLRSAGFLTTTDADGTTEEDRDPSLLPWEFADLMLHARSRLNRHDEAIGAAFAFRGRLPPLPAVKPPPRGRRIPLPRATEGSRLFASVLEARRSTRTFAPRPLGLDQLGAFLDRAVRVRRLEPAGVRNPYESTRRPSPSGGACHPIEVYLATGSCERLRPGLYHYDPVGHALTALRGTAAAARALRADARAGTGIRADTGVLLVLTARFARTSWKYRAITYATILKDVGAMLQTMYLVATDLELAACAVGSGDSTRLARAIGTRFHEESSVGELLLGPSAAPISR